MAVKCAEITALIESVEKNTVRAGARGRNRRDKEHLTETQQGLEADSEFLHRLATNCALKNMDWAARSRTRTPVWVTLAETIRAVNDYGHCQHELDKFQGAGMRGCWDSNGYSTAGCNMGKFVYRGFLLSASSI